MGEFGCLRLKFKPVGDQMLKFLSATSSGVSHRGFVIAMNPQMYQRVGELIESKAGATCSGHSRKNTLLSIRDAEVF